ncbi:PREDICTED: uncharacterized protein LOC109164828 [Ipomoea nil]|uniref:uncharacterized protein LOC109164828 n=1 Tax=Ipomoea nil TaxID=35883 RepID=UPI000901F0FF|nr:PREDICTED: uncharacterized protein LOC109164828 [Ipomoea nil]
MHGRPILSLKAPGNTQNQRGKEEEEMDGQRPGILSPCSSGRRSGDATSPEFEFWMLRNPSFPQPNLLSADELFSDGVLLPLDLLPQEGNACSDESPGEIFGSCDTDPPETSGSTRPGVSAAAAVDGSSGGGGAMVGGSKRWKDIFKKGEKKEKKGAVEENVKEKEKKEKKGGVIGHNGASAAELNINIWPFSRSRSAGNSGSRPRLGAAGSGLTHRKVSSAPCSRSNSAGESKSRKWPTSPTRAGVHLGRSSPVWQVRRSGGATTRTTENLSKAAEKALKKEPNADKPVKKDSNVSKSIKKEGNDCRRKNPSAVHGGAPKARVLNLNVPMCIGYRHHLSCRSDENSTIAVAAAAAAAAASEGGQNGGGVPGEAVRGSNLFNLRNLFTKKVY